MAIIPIDEATPSRTRSAGKVSNISQIKGVNIIPIDQANFGHSKANSATPIDRLIGGMVGGIPTAAGGARRAENIAPLVGQSVLAPFGLPAEIGGAAIGETGRQVAHAIRGEGFNPAEIGTSALATAITAGTLKGAEKTIFKREFAAKALQELGTQLGKFKTFLSQAGEVDPLLHTPHDEILTPLKKGFENINVQFGKAISVLKRWEKRIEFMKANNLSLTPKVLMEAEDDFGQAATFANKQVAGTQIQPEVTKKAANELAKRMRTLVSDKIDNAAIKAGIDEFPSISKKIYEIKKKFPAAELSKSGMPGMAKFLFTMGAGTGAGLYEQSPAAGIGAGLAVLAILEPSIRQKLFQGTVKTGITTGARMLGSEFARQIVKK